MMSDSLPHSCNPVDDMAPIAPPLRFHIHKVRTNGLPDLGNPSCVFRDIHSEDFTVRDRTVLEPFIKPVVLAFRLEWIGRENRAIKKRCLRHDALLITHTGFFPDRRPRSHITPRPMKLQIPTPTRSNKISTIVTKRFSSNSMSAPLGSCWLFVDLSGPLQTTVTIRRFGLWRQVPLLPKLLSFICPPHGSAPIMRGEQGFRSAPRFGSCSALGSLRHHAAYPGDPAFQGRV
jgi:hypothetical protein